MEARYSYHINIIWNPIPHTLLTRDMSLWMDETKKYVSALVFLELSYATDNTEQICRNG